MTKRIFFVILHITLYFIYKSLSSIYYTLYWEDTFNIMLYLIDILINLLFLMFIWILYKKHIQREVNALYKRSNLFSSKNTRNKQQNNRHNIATIIKPGLPTLQNKFSKSLQRTPTAEITAIEIVDSNSEL